MHTMGSGASERNWPSVGKNTASWVLLSLLPPHMLPMKRVGHHAPLTMQVRRPDCLKYGLQRAQVSTAAWKPRAAVSWAHAALSRASKSLAHTRRGVVVCKRSQVGHVRQPVSPQGRPGINTAPFPTTNARAVEWPNTSPRICGG